MPLRTAKDLVRRMEQNIDSAKMFSTICAHIRRGKVPPSSCSKMADEWVSRLINDHPRVFPSYARRIRSTYRYRLLAEIIPFLKKSARRIQKWFRHWIIVRRFKRGRRTFVLNDVDAFTLEPVQHLHARVYIQSAPKIYSRNNRLRSINQGWHVFNPVSLLQYVLKTGNVSNPFTRGHMRVGEEYLVVEHVFKCVEELKDEICSLLEKRASLKPNEKLRSILQFISAHRKLEITEIRNRASAASILVQSVQRQARTVLGIIEMVDSHYRPFRVYNSDWGARRPSPGMHPNAHRDLYTTPIRSPFREYRGPSWSEMSDGIILQRAGIPFPHVLRSLDSLVFGLTYLRDVDAEQYSRVHGQIYNWLHYMQQSRNILYGPIARRLAQRVAYRLVIRGVQVPVIGDDPDEEKENARVSRARAEETRNVPRIAYRGDYTELRNRSPSSESSHDSTFDFSSSDDSTLDSGQEKPSTLDRIAVLARPSNQMDETHRANPRIPQDPMQAAVQRFF